VDDPIAWCLQHRADAILAPAREGLVALSPADADRIVRLVVRRCRLNLVVMGPERAVVHYWGKEGLGDLRSFFKSARLARKDVCVVLCERKHEVMTVTSGAEFLFGVMLNESFPVGLYRRKWQNRANEEPDDCSAAPQSWSSFVWQGVRPLIPWAVLKNVWQRDELPCPNCDMPLIVTAFGTEQTGMFNRTPKLTRICPACRRLLRDDSILNMQSWVAAHLEGKMLPDSDCIRLNIVKWQPPRDR